MNRPAKKKAELIIHTCDGDDNLTPEQSDQAFCFTAKKPSHYVTPETIRELVLRYKVFTAQKTGPAAQLKLDFETRLEKQIRYWQLAQSVMKFNVRELIRAIKRSNEHPFNDS